MKLYEYEPFPNPRRVRMFLAEKGIEVPRVQVDVPAGEHRLPENLEKNPAAAVPFLELDNGDVISETVAISRYFEEQQPVPPLMGTTSEERARVEMWQRRVEHNLNQALGHYFHHATDGLGESDRYRNRDWGERNAEEALQTMRLLDRQLATHDYIAGDRFSIADITALCAIDFAQAVEIRIPEDCVHLQGWYERVSIRASAAA